MLGIWRRLKFGQVSQTARPSRSTRMQCSACAKMCTPARIETWHVCAGVCRECRGYPRRRGSRRGYPRPWLQRSVAQVCARHNMMAHTWHRVSVFPPPAAAAAAANAATNTATAATAWDCLRIRPALLEKSLSRRAFPRSEPNLSFRSTSKGSGTALILGCETVTYER